VIEFRHLIHALALAEHRNFARAAEALHLSQPALTRSIQNLEEKMGSLLFVRGRKGVGPTDAGQLMLKRARAIVGQTEDLMREGQAMKKRTSEIRIVAGPYAAQLIVAPTVARQLLAESTFRFDLRIDHWVKVVQLLKERRFDLAICESSEIDDSELELVPLRPQRGHVVVRAGHPLLESGEKISFDQVIQWPLAITARLPSRVLKKMILHVKEASFVPAVHCEDVGAIKSIVMNSDAVGFFPLPMISMELEQGLLRIVDVDAPWLETGFAVIRLKDCLLSKSVQSFIRKIQQTDDELAQRADELSARFLASPRREMDRAMPYINGTSISK
jgi:DNA-binding transcriptional LysR family regulator